MLVFLETKSSFIIRGVSGRGPLDLSTLSLAPCSPLPCRPFDGYSWLEVWLPMKLGQWAGARVTCPPARSLPSSSFASRPVTLLLTPENNPKQHCDISL